jgi:hypothetical protein
VSEYLMNEARFDLPDGFVDRTITYFEGRSESGADHILSIERHPVPKGKSLRELVAQHQLEGRKKLRGFTVIFEREAKVGEEPAIEVATRWRAEDVMVYTRQFHFVLGDTWLIAACEGPLEERVLGDRLIEHVVGTMRATNRGHDHGR